MRIAPEFSRVKLEENAWTKVSALGEGKAAVMSSEVN